MTRAAEKLFLTTSALSMLIRSLEEELGLRLFERTTRRVTLTDAGSELLPTALRTLDQLDSTVRLLQATHLKQGEVLKIATSPLLAASLMPTVISQFRLEFPGVRVELLDVPVADVVAETRRRATAAGVQSAPDVRAQKTALAAFSPAQEMTSTAGTIASARVMMRRSQGLRRISRKPSITTWPASLR